MLPPIDRRDFLRASAAVGLLGSTSLSTRG